MNWIFYGAYNLAVSIDRKPISTGKIGIIPHHFGCASLASQPSAFVKLKDSIKFHRNDKISFHICQSPFSISRYPHQTVMKGARSPIELSHILHQYPAILIEVKPASLLGTCRCQMSPSNPKRLDTNGRLQKERLQQAHRHIKLTISGLDSTGGKLNQLSINLTFSCLSYLARCLT